MSRGPSRQPASAQSADSQLRFPDSGGAFLLVRDGSTFRREEGAEAGGAEARLVESLGADPDFMDFVARCARQDGPVALELPWMDPASGAEALVALRGTADGPDRVLVRLDGRVAPRATADRLALLHALARETGFAQTCPALTERALGLIRSWTGCVECAIDRSEWGHKVADLPGTVDGVPLTAGGRCLGWLRIRDPRADRARHLTAGFLQLIGIVLGRALARLEREQSLRDSQRYFRMAVEAASDMAIYAVDPDGRIVGWNAGAERIFGYRGSEITGEPLETLYSREDAAAGKPAEDLRQARAHGLVREDGAVRNRKDGSRFVVTVVTRALRDEEGRLRGYSRVLLDVTAHSRKSQELEKSIQDLDIHLRELRCLYQLAALISDPSVSTEEVLARTVSLVPAAYRFPEIAQVRIVTGERRFETEGFSETPWEQTSVIGTFSSRQGSIQVCYREQRPEADEGPFSEGERDLIDMVGQLLGDFLERRATVESLRSTTALLERMVASSSYGIAFLDSSFRYSKVNDAFASMGGYDASGFVGRNHFELFPEVGDPETFREVLRTGKPFVAFDLPRQEGATFWDIEVLPVADRPDHRDDAADPAGPAGGADGTGRSGDAATAGRSSGQLVLILVNRTRGKKARMALERSREELRSLASHLQALREEERTRVAREVHDELGGLLTTLKMELSLVARRGSRNSCQEEYHSALELIEQSLAMIHRIAADLRPVVLDDFGLFPALEWYLRDFQKRTGISCDLRADPVEWTLDRSSAASLFRVVQEALTNVARHAHATTVTVDLHREGGRLRVSVEDNGVGIDEARLANTRSYGLIGIRERVLSLGGELAIRGAPGRGTTVSLSIPEGVLGGTP